MPVACADGGNDTQCLVADIEIPAETDIASATVILPCESGSGLVSDLLSTLIYIGGTENAEHYAEICGESFEDYGIITIDNSGNVTSYGSVDIVK